MRFRKPLIFLLAGAALAGVCTALFWPTQIVDRFERQLPAKLITEGLIVKGSDSDDSPPVWILGGRNESCGSVVFRLSESTADEIRLKGIAFFENAKKERQYETYSGASYLSWRVTPAQSRSETLEATVPARWAAKEYLASGLGCAKLDQTLTKELLEAADKPGAFYTTKHESSIFVIPDLKLIVFSWFG